MTLMRDILLSLFVFSGAALLSSSACLAAPSPEEQLGTLLKAHPELILDVLREHSEQLLDIVQQGSDTRRRVTLRKQWESDMKTHKTVTVAKRPVSGPDNAPVTIVAFSDFLCSYCHQAAFTLGDLMTRYKGKIRLVFKLTPKTETGRLAGSWFLAAYATMDKAKACLARGQSLAVFPEGRRSDDGTLGRFKPGAFKLSHELGVPIVPISIDGSYRVMPRDTFNVTPGKIVITLHEPLPPSEDAAQLAEEARAVIEAAIGQ